MRTVSLALSEEEVHRLYVALHGRIDFFRRLAANDGDLRVISKYQPLLDRISEAYQEFFTEEKHVGSEDKA